jgi:hypothetical protein
MGLDFYSIAIPQDLKNNFTSDKRIFREKELLFSDTGACGI